MSHSHASLSSVPRDLSARKSAEGGNTVPPTDEGVGRSKSSGTPGGPSGLNPKQNVRVNAPGGDPTPFHGETTVLYALNQIMKHVRIYQGPE